MSCYFGHPTQWGEHANIHTHYTYIYIYLFITVMIMTIITITTIIIIIIILLVQRSKWWYCFSALLHKLPGGRISSQAPHLAEAQEITRWKWPNRPTQPAFSPWKLPPAAGKRYGKDMEHALLRGKGRLGWRVLGFWGYLSYWEYPI